MPTMGRNCLACAAGGSQSFCRLSLAALTDLQDLGKHQSFDTGDRVLSEGNSADRVLVVCQGRIKLTASSADGRLLIVRVAGPGDVLGLAEALKRTTHKVSAEALEPGELKSIGRIVFLDFMDSFREVARNAVVAVASEYQGAMLSARRLALSGSAAGKLASVLLDWGRMGDEGADTLIRFRMPLTHEELGSMAGLSRETVTRLLGKFRREGLVEHEGEWMVLPQPAMLERLYS